MEENNRELPIEVIQIVCTTDKNYLQHCGVMLCSLFESNRDNQFVVHLITDRAAAQQLDKLNRLFLQYRQTLRPVVVDATKVDSLKVTAYASTAVYYRLIIPELLDSSLDKVLYLDSDMVVKANVKALWNTPIDGFVLGAVREPLYNEVHRQRIGLEPGVPYFNSGVMLLNLKQWRKENITERSIIFAKENPEKLFLWDQDVLNVVLNGHWLELNYKWNQTHFFFASNLQEIAGYLGLSNLQAVVPSVIHYSSHSKPWQFRDRHPLKHEYYHYLKKTPWKHFKNPEDTLWHKSKQLFKKGINKLSSRQLFEIYE